MREVIFEARGVSKEINGTKIINNISFRCEDFATTAIRGQNGSGKSTLLKILAGIYEPTNGKIIKGAKKVAYVPEHFPGNLRFRVREYLLLTSSFCSVSNNKNEADLLEYLRIFDLNSYIDKPLRQCSKGTKQKVGLIQALMMDPDILLLDEPLTGLDSSSKKELIQLLEKLKNQVTIIFTTHEKELIEKLADQILDIETGEVTLPIRDRIEQKLIRVKFVNKEIFTELKTKPLIYEGNTALITVDSTNCDKLLLDLLNKKCSIVEVKEKR